MPAASKKQQRLMGMAYAVKTGEMSRSEASDAVLDLADSMTLKQLHDFAATSHKNLPEEIEESGLTGFLSAGPFPRYTSHADNLATAWQGMERDKQDYLIQSFLDFIDGKRDKKTNEAEVGFAGVATPQGTPGMGNVVVPTDSTEGSGDRFDNGSAEEDKGKVGIMSYEDYRKWLAQWKKDNVKK